MARRPRDDDRGFLPFEGDARDPGSVPDAPAVDRDAPGSAEAARADRVRLARGPRAVEAGLERDVAAHVAEVRADPRRLARPLHVVVPSRALRDHVERRIARASGGAAAGVVVVTLRAWSRTLSERYGLPPPRGTRAFSLALARALPEVPLLARELGRFVEPTEAVRATLADLVDAGFEPAHAEAIDEALAGARDAGGAIAAEIARARHLVELAVRATHHHARRGFTRDAEHLRRLAQAVRADPARIGGTVAIHGFADATGSAADLLEALLATPGARVHVDTCADGEFGANVRARFGVPTSAAPPSAVTSKARVHLRAAVSPDAEARAAAEAVRAALDAGVAPESIGVVARDLEPYASALTRHLGRLGVPYSAPGTPAHDGGPERRARALCVLLRDRGATALDRWLDARRDVGGDGLAATRAESRVALRVLGLARLEELATFDFEARLGDATSVVLPVRALRLSEDVLEEEVESSGEDSTPDEDEEDPDVEVEERPATPSATASHRARRRVARAHLEALARDARALVGAFDAWPTAPASEHAARVDACLAPYLSWPLADEARAPFDAARDALTQDLGPETRLERDEYLELLQAALDESIGRPAGGRGLGVRVLSVTEARGATFEVLHVLGLVRGGFPRAVREDPLFPDAVRARVRPVLPDLPLKLTGRDEERVLFDQLLAAAPEVHVSWPTNGDDDKPCFPSPLLERAASPAEIAAVSARPDVLSQTSARAPRAQGPRPAFEHAVLAGLVGGPSALAPRLATAVREVRAYARLGDGVAVDAIAIARDAILVEHEGTARATPRLGPYLGCVGTPRERNDPRAGDVYVTTLEAVAACGWRAFLQRVLRLEPPLDPFADLPEIEPRLVGEVVHAVLDAVARASRGESREPGDSRTSSEAGEAGDSSDRRIVWPRERAFEDALRHVARAALVQRGILLAGFEDLVVERVRPFLRVARELDERESTTARLVASETERQLPLASGPLGPRVLRLRLDRVDALPDGQRGTDFKTGRPLSDKTADTRRRHHVQALARGTTLQAFGYARALGPNGRGRYVFLRETVADELRVFELGANDSDASAAFDAALRVLLGAWDRGALFPRLVGTRTDQANLACASCDMAQACLRGDSAANRRLARFVAEPPADPTHAAAGELWRLAHVKIEAPPKAKAIPSDPAARSEGKTRKRRGGAASDGGDA